MAELYDQHGYIFRIGVGGAVRWHDLLIRARDVDVFVNDDRWTMVKYVDAKAVLPDIRSLGEVDAMPPFEDGATGSLTLGAHGEGDRSIEVVLDRLQRVLPGSTMAWRVNDPETGYEIRRISFAGLRWTGPPSIDQVATFKAEISVDFRADIYSDDATPVLR